ncbi:hypothetical protein Trco_005335 [Trichoderma cornu-damae]|uniref:DUF4470 domain-containing protein n=1 Tax=Trichoderma cornu-damae TaxID=654480 RepID=A0A9P8QPB9_9HYPO|nr:hypothetical protein Trco_005335 [Trichoderma cornu-damae]
MLTPTVAYRYRWLYAIGNTAATDLARNIPHGQDASLLLLGCGDLRNILYTSYVEKGLVASQLTFAIFLLNLAARKLDFTCCDINENIIGEFEATNDFVKLLNADAWQHGTWSS